MASQADNESVHKCWRNVIQGILHMLPKLSNSITCLECTADLYLHLIPTVFDGIEIWATRWPGVHPIDVVVVQEIIDNAGAMRTGIVIHQRDVLCVVRHIWLHDGLMDLVNVPLCIHVAIDKHQICFTPDTYATPCHDPSTTSLETWLDVESNKSNPEQNIVCDLLWHFCECQI